MAWTTPSTVVAGQTLSAAFWNEQVRDNQNALYQTIQRIAYIERTSDYSISATTISGSTELFASDLTFTADGTSAYLVEFYSPWIVQPSVQDSYLSIVLTDGGNNGRGTLAAIGGGTGANNVQAVRAPCLARTYFTFSAGSVSLNIRGVVGSGTGVIRAGSGGTGVLSYFPAYLAVYGPALS